MTMRITPLTTETQSLLDCAEQEFQDELRGLALTRADASFVSEQEGRVHGWYSLWHTRAPQYQKFRTGCLGHFRANTRDTALALLEHASRNAKTAGLHYLLGPLDGDTWHSYRLTTDMHGYPPFFLDRLTPLEWADFFGEAGFAPVATYCSTVAPAVPYTEKATDIWSERFQAGAPWRLRPLCLEEFEEELRRIYALSCRAFVDNFLYTPIAWPDFLALYLPIKRYLRPELVQLAFRGDELAGFCLCVPDYAQAARGEAMDGLILKTFARDLDPACKGLGAFLMWNSHMLAAKQGFTRLITAFMHMDNVSLRLALKAGTIIRSYALYGREL